MRKRAEKSATIEVAAGELGQLFNSLDPSPFPQRDLNDETEAFIASWAKELSPCKRFRIIVHLPEAEIAKAGPERLGKAFSNYFAYRAEMLKRAERECLRKGRRFLFAGLFVLAVCNMLARLISAATHSSPFAQFAADGLVIFGWVANWRPAEIFLYDFWEIRRERRLHQQLAGAEIAVIAKNREKSAG